MQKTGRFRVRKNWWGKLIFQVEYVRNHCNDLNGSGYYDEFQTYVWKDAKWMDLFDPALTDKFDWLSMEG